VAYEINASELLGLRFGYISPASDVVAALDDATFDVPAGEGAKWQVGWEVALWEKAGGTGPLGVAGIVDVTGDTITVSPAFPLTPTTAHRIVFADYGEIVEPADDQRFFGFVGPDTGTFPDNHGPYLVS
jgi:hypothetical protein